MEHIFNFCFKKPTIASGSSLMKSLCGSYLPSFFSLYEISLYAWAYWAAFYKTCKSCLTGTKSFSKLTTIFLTTQSAIRSHSSEDLLFFLPCRSSHQRCSIKKGPLKNFAKFTWKHLCQSLCFNKFAGGLQLY